MAVGGPNQGVLTEQEKRFQAAVVQGNVQLVDQLLKQNPELAKLTLPIMNSSYKTSVLHDAVRAAAVWRHDMEKQIAMLQIIELLIKNGADPKQVQTAAGSAVDYPAEDVFGTARRLHDRSLAPTPFEAAYYPQLRSVLSGGTPDVRSLQDASRLPQVRQFRQESQQQPQPQPYYPPQGNQQQYEARWFKDYSQYWREIAPYWNNPKNIPIDMLNAAINFIENVYQEYGADWTDEYRAHYQGLVAQRDLKQQQALQQGPSRGQPHENLIKNIQELEKRILQGDPNKESIERLKRLRDQKVLEVVDLFFNNSAYRQNFLQNLKNQPDSVLEAVRKKFAEYQESRMSNSEMRADHVKILEEQHSRIQKQKEKTPPATAPVRGKASGKSVQEDALNVNSPALLHAFHRSPPPKIEEPKIGPVGNRRFGVEVNIAPGIDDDTLKKWKKDNGFSSESTPPKKGIVFDYDKKTGKIFVSAANRADVEAVLNKLNESPPQPPSPERRAGLQRKS